MILTSFSKRKKMICRCLFIARLFVGVHKHSKRNFACKKLQNPLTIGALMHIVKFRDMLDFVEEFCPLDVFTIISNTGIEAILRHLFYDESLGY
jgi:hypothetical protein